MNTRDRVDEGKSFERTVRVALVALWSPKNARYWSGTPHYSFKALHAQFPNLHLIDTPVLDRILFYTNKAARRLNIDPLREPMVAWIYYVRVARQLAVAQPDVIVSVGASHKLCHIEGRWPIIHSTDALFATIIATYPSLARLSSRSKSLGEKIQRKFLGKVDVLCLSSDWAVKSARDHYDLSGCRVEMLPMGANLDHDPGFDLSARSSLSQLSLLFIGGDWERKGGPLLIEIFRMLQSRDPGVELNIVGCRPSLEAGLHGVKVHGVLRKSDRDDARLLDSLFRRSAFLAVPSRQEAYGLVYCEACAHGVPPIAAETGGVGSIIVDGVNGLLFSLDDLPKAYVNRILEVWSDRDRYLRMSSCARTHYENRLSWNAWARGISSFAEDCLGDARRADA